MAIKIANISDGLWEDLKRILEYMVIKNNQLASEYETEETRHNAVVYFSAVHHSGPLLTYKDYLTYPMLASVMLGENPNFINQCLDDPTLVPMKYRGGIIKLAEEAVIDKFIEKNDYYRMLLGLPPMETKPSEYLYLDKDTYEEFEIKKIVVDGEERYPAIHEMDKLTQDIITKTEAFQKLKEEHSDQEWLNYLGKNAIPLEQARNAKEFEIIRLFPDFALDTNPELTRHFSNEYNRARSWFVNVMWNADMELASLNYRQFVSFSITVKALRMTLNRQFDGIIENSFLNDTLVTILFNLYRLPTSVASLSRNTRRQLALELRKLIRDRAGNSVLYDVARILGYDDVIISKIVMNKNQIFEGEDQEAVHATIDAVKDPITDEVYPVDDPYHSFERTMQAIDLKTKNIRDDILTQKHLKDYVREVTGPDPRWWEDHNPDSDDGLYPSDEEGFLRNNYDEIKRLEFNQKMFKDNQFGNPEEDIPVSDPLDPKYDEVYWGLSEEERRHPTWFFPGWNSVDTKYMLLTYQYSMADKTFETIYLMRYLLDKQAQTKLFMNKLDQYGGTTPHSLYDIVLFLVCGLNRLMFGSDPYKNNDYGQILQNSDKYQSIMGFNVDLSSAEINDYLARCEYLDADYVKELIEETNFLEQEDVKAGYATGILGLRDYLVTRMEMANTITEWREANKLFDMMFHYDPVRDIHAKPGTKQFNKENNIPDIRYKIYDMEVSLFGGVTANIGDPVSIVIPTLVDNVSSSHEVVVGVVSAVDADDKVTEVNFRYPFEKDDRYALPTWNNPNYNTQNSIDLISDNHLDKGDLYNPSGQNGPSIEEGSYPATIGKQRSSGMYIRVTETWYHTRDLYEKYLDELVERDPFLGDFVAGKWSDSELLLRLNEACDLLSEILDQDMRYLRESINGDKTDTVLMDMIKYIKSYTVDFITSEKRYILNDKGNPEWIRLIDQLEFDPYKPVTITTREVFQLYDALKEEKHKITLLDGKNLPKNELDLDAFERGNPRLTDRLIKVEKDNVEYHYEIDEHKIVSFSLPVDTQRGTAFEDVLNVKAISGNDKKIPVKIYMGNNPPENEGYIDSGFTFKTQTLAEKDLPIYFSMEELPIQLDVNTFPEYGVPVLGENGYVTVQFHCSHIRVDLDHPQNN